MTYDNSGATYPRRRRRIWPWLLLAGVLLCGGAGVAIMGAIGGGVKAVQQEEVARDGDIKISDCKKTIIGTVEVTYTLTNGGNTARTYMPEFRVDAKDGTIIGQATDITPEVAPGKRYSGKAVGTLDSAARNNFKCVLVGS